MTAFETGPELVVLLDDEGRAIGTTEKAGVHHADTPLHLAFSCYVLDAGDGVVGGEPRVLLTQRSLAKRTWPGVWTNTVCGHPAPGEPLPDAVRRRARDELGLHLSDVRLLLPDFGYLARMDDGTTEHELCPVYVARVAGSPEPAADPSEVEATSWEPWAAFREAALAGVRPLSPWCVEQLRLLPDDLTTAPTASDALLPPAARDVSPRPPP